MSEQPIDDLDRAILHLLQVDARNNTNREIGEEVDVAASTVGTRIKQLEDRNVINGYHPSIDYERAGLPLHSQFVCTASLAERRELADEALDVYGVVDVQETIAGENNVRVETVSRNLEELEQVAQDLIDVGLTLHRSAVLRRHRMRPFDHFGAEQLDE